MHPEVGYAIYETNGFVKICEIENARKSLVRDENLHESVWPQSPKMISKFPEMNPPADTSVRHPIPAYKSRGATRAGNHWECYSTKLGRRVHLYSDLEYDHWLLVESDANVLTFCEQPCFASIWHEGAIHRSVPDMWIKYANGNEMYVEVKYLKDLENPSAAVEKQLKIQKEWTLQRGMTHKVITEMEIRKNTILLSNLTKMAHSIRIALRASSEKIRTNAHEEVMAILYKHGGDVDIAKVLELASPGYSTETTLSAIFSAIFSGSINAQIAEQKIHAGIHISINN